MLRYVFHFALALAGFAGCLSAASAPVSAGEPRHAAMAIDANTGQILQNDEGDAKRHPASLTKMMTLYLVFDTLRSGRMSMSSRITISPAAASAQPSKLGLEAGEDLSVSDAIKVLITKSANDIATAVAEKVGGSEINFVRLMNARARELGMNSTRFKNASGLPDREQVTTARDMITLALRLQDDFPEYYPLFATRQTTVAGRSMRNHNTLLNSFAGIDGIKTGYTRMSGFNLVSSVRRGNRHVVAAVFGGSSAASRNGEMRALLTRVIPRASTNKTRKAAPALIAKLKSAPKLAARAGERAKADSPQRVAVVVAPKPPAAKRIAQPFAPPRYVANAAPQTIEELAAAPIVAEAAPSTPIAHNRDTGPTIAELAAEPAPVQVFKVKRVVVLPRPSTPADPEATTDTPVDTASTDAVAAMIAPTSIAPTSQPFVNPGVEPSSPADALAETFANSRDTAANPVNETIVAKLPSSPLSRRYDAAPAPANIQTAAIQTDPISGAPQPSATLEQVAMLGAVADDNAPIQQTSNQRRPSQLGLPPSSLQAQASTLGKPLVASQPSRSSGADVQIGAYETAAQAAEALTNVKTRAATALAGAAAVTVPVEKAGRMLYRARFSGLSASSAASACTELRRQSIDCFVLAAR